MIYCAFFRGINLNGVKMTMPVIKERFEKLGFSNVITILATGNVIFCADDHMESSEIVDCIKDDLSTYYDREVYIFLKTLQDTEHVIEHAVEYDAKLMNLYWMLVDNQVNLKSILNEFDPKTAMEGELVVMRGGELYWVVPKGFTLKTPFGKVLGKKKYQQHLTSRNVNTVKKVLNKMKGL